MKAEEIQKLVVVDVKDDRFTVTKKIGMCRELEHFATVYHLLNPPLGKTTERNLTKVELYDGWEDTIVYIKGHLTLDNISTYLTYLTNCVEDDTEFQFKSPDLFKM
tara:strand:- start:226 stop:543 length:318 start_codon:yes stop_codon:yes gene_type:complete